MKLRMHASIIERLSAENGAIRAASTARYEAMWLRDQLYCVLGFLESGMREDARRHFRPVLLALRKYRYKLQAPYQSQDSNRRFEHYLHAKLALDLEELTPEWGHHQLDALGLLLFVAAKLPEMFGDQEDLACLEDLVSYLRKVAYWRDADFGMWEENYCLHSSSIGAVISGLQAVRSLIPVEEALIDEGRCMLKTLLPHEGLERKIDLALLSLIWPHELLERDMTLQIVDLVETKLAGQYGTCRYLGDRYVGEPEKGPDGVRSEWPLGFLWLSVCHSRMGYRSAGAKYLDKGINKGGDIPELRVVLPGNAPPEAKNGPLAWAHALAMVALAHVENAG